MKTLKNRLLSQTFWIKVIFLCVIVDLEDDENDEDYCLLEDLLTNNAKVIIKIILFFDKYSGKLLIILI